MHAETFPAVHSRPALAPRPPCGRPVVTRSMGTKQMQQAPISSGAQWIEATATRRCEPSARLPPAGLYGTQQTKHACEQHACRDVSGSPLAPRPRAPPSLRAPRARRPARLAGVAMARPGTGVSLPPAGPQQPERDLEPLSRALARLLRYPTPEEAMSRHAQGWCRLREVVAQPRLRAWSEAEVWSVIMESKNQDGERRFQMAEYDRELWVRARWARLDGPSNSSNEGGVADASFQHGFPPSRQRPTPPFARQGWPPAPKTPDRRKIPFFRNPFFKIRLNIPFENPLQYPFRNTMQIPFQIPVQNPFSKSLFKIPFRIPFQIPLKTRCKIPFKFTFKIPSKITFKISFENPFQNPFSKSCFQIPLIIHFQYQFQNPCSDAFQNPFSKSIAKPLFQNPFQNPLQNPFSKSISKSLSRSLSKSRFDLVFLLQK